MDSHNSFPAHRKEPSHGQHLQGEQPCPPCDRDGTDQGNQNKENFSLQDLKTKAKNLKLKNENETIFLGSQKDCYHNYSTNSLEFNQTFFHHKQYIFY